MENQIDKAIKEIKFQNEKNLIKYNNDIKDRVIYIAFEQINSNKIQFVSEYIKKNYKNDNYKYIFIIHIQRSFNLKNNNNNNKMIYSIPDIDPEIEQLFIDNLNGPNIKFKDLLKKNVKDIMNDNSVYMNLNNEFKRLLTNFVYKELNNKRNNTLIYRKSGIIKNLKEKDNKYLTEIIKYMEINNVLKEKIIDKAKNFFFEDKNAAGNTQKLLDKILMNNYIGKNTIDIISCLLNYIKEEIFGKYIKYIFTVLEDNNILTTLIDIQNDKNNEIDGTIIQQLLDNLLDMITFDDTREYDPKFLYNFKIPGFYNSYNYLSDYINKNIMIDYFNYEKNLRKYEAKANVDKKINEFNKKENELLSSLYDHLSDSDKFFFENVGKIDTVLVLKDFISFYLDKYDLQNEENNNLIELLLNLRYSPKKNKIIKEYETEPIKIILMKIIWMETNSNYILNILKIYSYTEKIFYDKNKVFGIINNMLNDEDKNIKYIINETRNPEYTKEVNECYYILLASFCLCLTDKNIELSENLGSIDKNIVD